MENKPQEDLNEFLDRNIPDNLYHYTNFSGLQGIMADSEIWLSNMYFLNDRSEFELGIEYVIKQLQSYKDGFSILRPTKHFIFALEKAIEFIQEKEPPYIMSLTENNDLLSQWRGYTQNGVGVNIGFDKSFFANNSLHVFRCIYDSEKQKALINYIITESIFMFVGISNSQGIFENSNDIELSKFDEAITIAGQYFIDRTVLACSLIKSSSFQEESEWRLLYFKKNLDINFLNKGNYFKPYVKFKINDLDKSINEIYIGPNPERELCNLSMKMLLKKYGVDVNKIRFSSIPYRN